MTLNKLQSIISLVAGITIEITVRGEKQFTFSFEGKNEGAIDKIKGYFKNGFSWGAESGYYEECDLTCLYANA
jgi:hypothetical protein